MRPILDLRPLNRALSKGTFKMIMMKQILMLIQPGDYFMAVDLPTFAPHHRVFLRFAFKGFAYESKVLLFGLPLAPCTFTKCMNAA